MRGALQGVMEREDKRENDTSELSGRSWRMAERVRRNTIEPAFMQDIEESMVAGDATRCHSENQVRGDEGHFAPQPLDWSWCVGFRCLHRAIQGLKSNRRVPAIQSSWDPLDCLQQRESVQLREEMQQVFVACARLGPNGTVQLSHYNVVLWHITTDTHTHLEHQRATLHTPTMTDAITTRPHTGTHPTQTPTPHHCKDTPSPCTQKQTHNTQPPTQQKKQPHTTRNQIQQTDRQMQTDTNRRRQTPTDTPFT